MNGIILSIGDELVLGQTVDTNSAWLSSQLAAIGCRVIEHRTIPDDQPATQQAIVDALSRCDLLLISGGLGPTADDLTRQAIASVMQQPLEENDFWLGKLEEFFQRIKRPMPPSNRIQAMIPRGASLIDNSCGTAPGIRVLLPRPQSCGGGDCMVFAMPGVPREMFAMFTDHILPQLRQRCGGAVVLSRTLHTFGLGESTVGERLGDLMRRDRNPSVGTTVADGVVSLRLNARFGSSALALSELDATESACHSALGDLIYGRDRQTLPQVTIDLLTSAGKTIATAESCTGGLLAQMLTSISGSSNCFTHGWVTYSNAAKQQLLGVPSELIAHHGAVSEPVVKAMAEGARKLAASDFALSISGIAGPTGGTAEKPVGTLCLALATPRTTLTRTFNFPGDRPTLRDRAAKTALALLRFQLLDKPTPF